ncbi:hypothetical protein [Streptomyces sp. NPDC005549]
MGGHQIQWARAPYSVDMAQRLRTHLDRLYHSLSTTEARLPAKALPD